MAKDTTNVRQLNQHVDLNLDELERDKVAPFSFVLAGTRVEMLDPHEIDIKDLMTIENPINFLKFALSDDAKKLVFDNPVPSWKFNQLMEQYMEHYGLDPRAGKGWLS